MVIHIGTNNLAGTKNARENTPKEIAEAIGKVVETAHAKCPAATIVVMAVFPRGEKADNPYRAKIAAINEALVSNPVLKLPGVTHLDITKKFLNADDSISKDVMGDFLHPSEKGYAIWAEALKPFVP
jgi:lysophospholipase L1-like esterase